MKFDKDELTKEEERKEEERQIFKSFFDSFAINFFKAEMAKEKAQAELDIEVEPDDYEMDR